MVKTFEDLLVPHGERFSCALGNVAADALGMPQEWQREFHEIAAAYYPGWEKSPPKTSVKILNLSLPGKCNATCPGICYTDSAHHKSSSSDLSWEHLERIIREFHELGGKAIRLVGIGEPTLSPLFPQLCALAKQLGIALIVFTNGIVLPKWIYDEYKSNKLLYFYMKHWSDDAGTQNRLVRPSGKHYHYNDGEFGPASDVLYSLHALAPERVGLQVMVATFNLSEAQPIIDGPKRNLPLFIEPFIPEGDGREKREWMPPKLPWTKECDNPLRASYTAVVNERGELQAGTFVRDHAISTANTGFKEVWRGAHTTSRTFFEARYHRGGCFCELMRKN